MSACLQCSILEAQQLLRALTLDLVAFSCLRQARTSQFQRASGPQPPKLVQEIHSSQIGFETLW